MRMSFLSILSLSRTCVFLASIVLVASDASRWTQSGLQDTRLAPANPKPVSGPAPSDPRICQKEKCLRGGKESPADHKTRDSASKRHRVLFTQPLSAAALNRA